MHSVKHLMVVQLKPFTLRVSFPNAHVKESECKEAFTAWPAKFERILHR